MLRASNIGLGLGGPQPHSGHSVGDDVILEADFNAGHFVFSGHQYESESAFLSAVGGVRAGNALRLGPHVDAGAPELLSDGGFETGVGNWVTIGTPAPDLAVVGGELRISASGSNTASALCSIVSLIETGKAYRLEGAVRRGETGALSPVIGFGKLASGGSTHLFGQSVNAASTVKTPAVLYCGGLASDASVCARAIVNPATGIYYADDFSLKEALPYAGFQAGEFSGTIEATAPSVGGVDRVLFQADDNAEFNGSWIERNYVRIVWMADGHLRLVAAYAGTGTVVEQANLDLGVVAPGAAFTVAFSAKLNDFRAALVGQPVQEDAAGVLAGIATMRLGKARSDVDLLWTGSIQNVRLCARAKTANEFLGFARGDSIVAWGDSLTSGTGATGGSAGPHTYPAVAQNMFSPPHAVINRGIGGQTSTQIAARMNAQPILVAVAGNVIPATGGVSVTTKAINVLQGSGVYSGTQVGWLAGVKGTMSTDIDGNWTFTRLVVGAPKACPAGTQFVCELGEVLRPRTAWLWLGRNGAQNGFSVASDIAAAVASLGHQRYLVGSVLIPTALGDSGTINAQLAETYGARFVDVLQALIGANDGSPADLADVANGYTPTSLRVDEVHLTDAGYAIAAAQFKAAHDAMGWS